jgi:hypothetical protein
VTRKLTAQCKDVWGKDPSGLLRKYVYQPRLTSTLDRRKLSDWDREAFYEIVLWKINRWPDLDDNLLSDLPSVSKLKP